MENNIQIFEHEEFGQIRTIEIDCKIYFVGTDVSTALKYTNPQKAVRDHVEKDDRTKRSVMTQDKNGVFKTREMSLINESGFYCLVLASKLIRKTDTYLENFVDKQKNMWYNITVSRTIASRSINS